jgi:hypothetical protein
VLVRRLFLIGCLILVACASAETQTPVTGSVSDPSVVQELMKQFNVPGLSITIINDFKRSVASPREA